MSEKYKPKLFESEQEIVTKFEKARREQDQVRICFHTRMQNLLINLGTENQRIRSKNF